MMIGVLEWSCLDTGILGLVSIAEHAWIEAVAVGIRPEED
jgi:hypothetical protein